MDFMNEERRRMLGIARPSGGQQGSSGREQRSRWAGAHAASGSSESSARQKALEVAARLSAKLGKRPRDEGEWASQSRAKRKKIFIPVRENPDMNFFGLLIGPRGATQKQMEQDSGAKIFIRGKGSARDGNDLDGDEDLHVLIMADTDQQISRAESLVNTLLFDPDKRAAIKQRQLSALKDQRDAEARGSTAGLPDALYASDSFDGPTPSELFGRGGSHLPAGASSTRDVFIPAQSVGLVIGRGGDTIRSLQDMTACSIQCSKSDEPDGTRRITLTGTEKQIKDAEAEIMRISGSDRRVHGGGHYGPGGGGHQMDVPNDMVGLIIGRGGETIRQLEQHSGASIKVSPAQEQRSDGMRTVTFLGTPDQIKAAEKEVGDMVKAHGAMRGGGLEALGPDTERVNVPNAVVGVIIGRGGESIKALQAKTGCRVQVSKDSSTPDREILLSGPPAVRAICKQEIMNLLVQPDNRCSAHTMQEMSEILQLPIPGSGYGGAYGQSYGYDAYQQYGYGAYAGYDQYQQAGYQQQAQEGAAASAPAAAAAAGQESKDGQGGQGDAAAYAAYIQQMAAYYGYDPAQLQQYYEQQAAAAAAAQSAEGQPQAPSTETAPAPPTAEEKSSKEPPQKTE